MNYNAAHDNILAALRALASACDGAVTQDKKGFNGPDSGYGKKLASKQHLSRKQLESAFEMLGKYRKQLSEKHGIELVDSLPPRKTIATPDRSNPLSDAMNALWQDAERIVGLHPAEQLIAESVASAEAFWNEGDEILDGIFATASQASALNALWAWYHGPEEEFLLMGFAGTGKTVLLQAFLKALRDHAVPCSTVFTAPTNKATAVLAAMVSQWELGIECRTAASLLGLKPVRDYETGNEYFKPDNNPNRATVFVDLAVVDEGSMASGDQPIGDKVAPGLYGLMRSGIINGHIPGKSTWRKLLWIADSAQIPPVGQEASPVFSKVKNRAVLTDVKRYGGAILKLATDIRNNLNSPTPPEMFSVPDEGLWVLPRTTFNAQLLKAAGKGAFDDGSSRCIAWTNKRTDSVAAMLRGALYGDDAPQIVEGEQLVVGSPYAFNYQNQGRDNSEVLLKTSEEYKVRSVTPGVLRIDGIESPALGIGADDATWDVLWLEFYGDPFFVKTKDVFGDVYAIEVTRFPVLCEHERKRYNATVKQMAKTAKASKKWKPYYRLKDAFADMRSALSLTVHKAQGSTFHGYTFVDASDILRCSGKGLYYNPETDAMEPCKERLRLLYTAITRAGGSLVIGL